MKIVCSACPLVNAGVKKLETHQQGFIRLSLVNLHHLGLAKDAGQGSARNLVALAILVAATGTFLKVEVLLFNLQLLSHIILHTRHGNISDAVKQPSCVRGKCTLYINSADCSS